MHIYHYLPDHCYMFRVSILPESLQELFPHSLHLFEQLHLAIAADIRVDIMYSGNAIITNMKHIILKINEYGLHCQGQIAPLVQQVCL
jgi:hypothetical protein